MVLTDEQHNYIVEVYNILKTEKGRLPYRDEAIQLFKDKFGFEISMTTVLRKWKEAEFELQKRGNTKGGRISKSDFFAICDECNNEINCVVRRTLYSRKNVIRLYHKYNLNYDVQPVTKVRHIIPKYLRYSMKGLEDNF